MKKLTTLLLTIIALSCNGQEPDLTGYTIGTYENNIAYRDSIIAVLEAKNKLQSELLEALVVEDRTDTITKMINDGNIQITLIKEASNVWVSIIDVDYRINTNFVNGVTQIILMEDLKSIASINADINRTNLGCYVNR